MRIANIEFTVERVADFYKSDRQMKEAAKKNGRQPPRCFLFNPDEDKNNLALLENGGRVFCDIMFKKDRSDFVVSSSFGRATCSMGDKFDEDKGKALAFIRAIAPLETYYQALALNHLCDHEISDVVYALVHPLIHSHRADIPGDTIAIYDISKMVAGVARVDDLFCGGPIAYRQVFTQESESVNVGDCITLINESQFLAE